LSSSLSSHQSQIAIAATIRMMTMISGQFNLLAENEVDACAVCAAGVGFAETIGAVVGWVAAVPAPAALVLVVIATPAAPVEPADPVEGVVTAVPAALLGAVLPVPIAVPALDETDGIVIATLPF